MRLAPSQLQKNIYFLLLIKYRAPFMISSVVVGELARHCTRSGITMLWQDLPTLPTSFSNSSWATTLTSLYLLMPRAKM